MNSKMELVSTEEKEFGEWRANAHAVWREDNRYWRIAEARLDFNSPYSSLLGWLTFLKTDGRYIASDESELNFLRAYMYMRECTSPKLTEHHLEYGAPKVPEPEADYTKERLVTP